MTEQETAPKRPPLPDQSRRPSSSGASQSSPRPRRKVLPLIVVALGVAAFFIWRGYFANPKIPDSVVTVSGRIEGDDSAVSPKTTGRIIEIRVREGDTVKAGDTIAMLDDAQVRAREDQARAALSRRRGKSEIGQRSDCGVPAGIAAERIDDRTGQSGRGRARAASGSRCGRRRIGSRPAGSVAESGAVR